MDEDAFIIDSPEHLQFDAENRPTPIGEGGYSKVYKVSINQKDEAALKLLRTVKDVEELTLEVEIQKRFAGHPSIVTLIDYGISEDFAWILMGKYVARAERYRRMPSILISVSFLRFFRQTVSLGAIWKASVIAF